jgi:hypothetical protein
MGFWLGVLNIVGSVPVVGHATAQCEAQYSNIPYYHYNMILLEWELGLCGEISASLFMLYVATAVQH